MPDTFSIELTRSFTLDHELVLPQNNVRSESAFMILTTELLLRSRRPSDTYVDKYQYLFQFSFPRTLSDSLSFIDSNSTCIDVIHLQA